MDTIITLKQFTSPSFFVPSTGFVAFPTPGGGSSSFSFPPILYYALKAKQLSSLNLKSEVDAQKLGYLNVSRDTTNLLKEKARGVHTDLINRKANGTISSSCFIQHRLLAKILGEKETYNDFDFSGQSISVNALRAKKNVTIPPYLFNRLISFMGSAKGARMLIHDLVLDILKELEDTGFLNTVNGKRELIKEAKDSSWSRKLHNRIIILLIESSGIKEATSELNMFDVEMRYEPKFVVKSN